MPLAVCHQFRGDHRRLGAKQLTAEDINRTLGVLLKYQEDVTQLKGDGARGLLAEITAGR